jgi:hypothetical protein
MEPNNRAVPSDDCVPLKPIHLLQEDVVGCTSFPLFEMALKIGNSMHRNEAGSITHSGEPPMHLGNAGRIKSHDA